ncbi:MAG: hypothetical protein ATN35_00725 [Epulopiscium sp. Nele67-Bin004]|nr:MAG: hypothetical protein ATN35_00725 [Epulopiscium sp. Nele67-Bin004]
MANTNKQDLKQLFSQEMLNLYKKISKEVKYKSSALLTQIQKYGGYEAALKYVSTDSNTIDFGMLWEAQRLDLSIEALLIKDKYVDIVPEDVRNFCDSRLKKYNYAPNIIEEHPAPKKTEILATPIKAEESLQTTQPEKEKEHKIYNEQALISTEQWSELFINQKIFTPKNQDLLIRMYLAGGNSIKRNDLMQEDGYPGTYPYKEVIMALGKRIKTQIKVDVPQSETGDKLWWNIIFVGWFEDNKAFEWSIAPRLYEAIDSLISTNQLDISNIEISMNTDEIKQRTKIETKEDDMTKKVLEAPQQEDKKCQSKHEIGTIDNVILQEVEKPTEEKETVSEPVEKSWKNNSDLDEEERLDAFLDDLFADDDDPVDEEPSYAELAEIEKMLNSPYSPIVEPAVPYQQPVATPIQDDEKLKETLAKWEQLKSECLDYYGASCEICGIDFGYTYGEQFENLIGVRNLKSDKEEWDNLDVDPEKDLVPMCSNCSCVMKSKTPPYTLDEMKKIYNK